MGAEEVVERTAKDTTAGPDAAQSGSHSVATVGSHGGLDNLERLAKGGNLEHVEAGSEEQVGELDGLLLQLPGDGRSCGGGGGHDDSGSGTGEGALTKGRRVLLRRRVDGVWEKKLVSRARLEDCSV